MIKSRLNLLADVLDRFRPSKRRGGFNLSGWFGNRRPECGTTACACGIATYVPRFKELGLGRSRSYGRAGHRLAPTYAGQEGWEAIQKFFRLSEDQAHYLFMGHRYPDTYDTTARQVAARIREFVQSGGVVRF